MNYCADCAHFDLRDRREAAVGLGLCRRDPKPGHYKTAHYPRECKGFQQADAKTIEIRMSLWSE